MSLCNFAKNSSIGSKVPIFKLNLLTQESRLQFQLSLLSVTPSYCSPTSLHSRSPGLLTVPGKYQACSHLTVLAWVLSSPWNALPPSISDVLEIQVSALVSIWERPPVTVSAWLSIPYPSLLYFIILTWHTIHLLIAWLLQLGCRLLNAGTLLWSLLHHQSLEEAPCTEKTLDKYCLNDSWVFFKIFQNKQQFYKENFTSKVVIVSE